MAQFKINGELLPATEHIRVREFAEAEKALGLNAQEAGMAGTLAIALYVALRRKDPDKSAGLIADEVLDMDMEAIDSTEDEVPLDSSPDAQSEPGPENQQISGHPPLEALG